MYGVTVPRAQIRDTTQPKIPLQFDPDLLFQKTGKQRITSWILPGAGAGLTIAKRIAHANTIESAPADPYGIFLSTAQTVVVMLLAGATAMVAIPFFIISYKNSRGAPSCLKNESGSLYRHLHNNEIFFPFRISINT